MSSPESKLGELYPVVELGNDSQRYAQMLIEKVGKFYDMATSSLPELDDETLKHIMVETIKNRLQNKYTESQIKNKLESKVLNQRNYMQIKNEVVNELNQERLNERLQTEINSFRLRPKGNRTPARPEKVPYESIYPSLEE